MALEPAKSLAVAEATTVRLIATKAVTGRGVEDDPIRVVHHLYTLEGALVAVYDPEKGGLATAELAKLMDGPVWRAFYTTGAT